MKNKRAKASVWMILILVLGLGTVSYAKIATLRIISLECLETEDSETDEVLLKVVGESQAVRYRRNMRAGDFWVINTPFPIIREFTVRLYDRDDGPFDHTDYLGGVTIGARPTNGERTAIFNRDGARYKLLYRVEP